MTLEFPISTARRVISVVRDFCFFFTFSVIADILFLNPHEQMNSTWLSWKIGMSIIFTFVNRIVLPRYERWFRG